MIPVQDGDREALVDFMLGHAPILMFPLTNLNLYGLRGDHPRSIDAWVAKDGDTITDVLTMTKEGIVFPCCPNGDWAAVAQIMRGRQIKGILGEGDQVAGLRRAIGLTREADLDVIEPAFVLDLADIVMPNCDSFTLHPLAAAPRDLLVEWRSAYQVETLEAPESDARDRAAREIDAYLKADSHRLLFRGGVPVAMTGFNAQLPEIVQIGGVYTPPELRSRGYARVALAMHLLETSIDGVTQAVLSAANEAAARAYIALGFQRSGSFAIAIYEDPQVAHG
jgi:GNAT superfamily N-acetyltransferase